jgi:hypothetical protein
MMSIPSTTMIDNGYNLSLVVHNLTKIGYAT